MNTFAFTKANHIIDCGGKVRNAYIDNTDIDMAGKVITSHGTPLNPPDVANKQYVDDIAASVIKSTTVTLTGTNYSLINSDLSGDLQVSIKNLIPGGPSASFTLVKSESGRQPSYTRSGSSAGISTNERLDVKWDPGDGLSLKKTGINYNGTYQIRIVKNII